jgi:uncharacterized membrane protein
MARFNLFTGTMARQLAAFWYQWLANILVAAVAQCLADILVQVPQWLADILVSSRTVAC